MIFTARSRRSFVAANPAIFGVGRMWEIFTETSDNPSQIRVFYDLPSALKWLNLESLRSNCWPRLHEITHPPNTLSARFRAFRRSLSPIAPGHLLPVPASAHFRHRVTFAEVRQLLPHRLYASRELLHPSLAPYNLHNSRIRHASAFLRTRRLAPSLSVEPSARRSVRKSTSVIRVLAVLAERGDRPLSQFPMLHVQSEMLSEKKRFGAGARRRCRCECGAGPESCCRRPVEVVDAIRFKLGDAVARRSVHRRDP